MSHHLNRRAFGRLALRGGFALAAASALPRPAWAESRLRMAWWGNPERDRRTYDAAALYQSLNDEVTVDLEHYPWSDYWQKLATQAASGVLPDVFQTDYRHLCEYARRGAVARLDGFLGGALGLSGFDQRQLDAGKVDGELCGLSMGVNTAALACNLRLLEAAGIELPDTSAWTIDDFVALGKDARDALPDGVFWTMNFGFREPMLEAWVRQRGKALYSEEGQPGFDEEDLADFWAYWLALQQQGLTPPPEAMARTEGSMEQMMLVTGRTAFDFLHSNQLVAAQALVTDTLELVMIPGQEGGGPGQYLKPGMLLSMSATTADPAAAAALIDFFITDTEANQILLLERGLSADARVRRHVMASLSETEQKIVAYLERVAEHASALPPLPPVGAGEIDRAFGPAFQSVAAGETSVADAAADFYAFARATLAPG